MKQYLHFKSSVGRRLLSVSEIVEVIPMVSLQREDADALNEKFCGLLNFRGSVVPVFSLSKYEEFFCKNPSAFLIVSKNETNKLAIVAEELDYLLDIRDDQINSVRSSNGNEFNVAKIGDDMVRIVQTKEFIYSC